MGLRAWIVGLVAAAAVAAAGTAPAHAAFGIAPGSFDGGAFNADGSAFTQAGGHPSQASTRFELNTVVDEFGSRLPDGAPRDIDVDVPAGFVGDPTATPTCPGLGALVTRTCAPSTQVGFSTVAFANGVAPATVTVPVFSMDPPSGSPAAFGFVVFGTPVYIVARLRAEGDYGVSIEGKSISQGLALIGTEVTLWGVPSDPVHDADRGYVDLGGFFGACVATTDPQCSNPSEAPRKPFLTNPTRCTAAGVGLETRIRATPWDESRAPDADSFFTHLPPGAPLPPSQWGPQQGPTGCESLPFDPSLDIRPTTALPDAPSGLAVDLSIPQNENPDGVAQAHLKRAKVVLPEGMTISPSAADGLAACQDSQLKLGSREPAICPEASKIGTATVDTPLLEDPLEGSVHIRSQSSDDPMSGEMFRIAIVLRDDERGIVVKLPGQVRANPDSGRLETTFDDNPQLPFERLRLRLKGGPRAPLATPPTCGIKSVDAELTSWGGQVVRRSSSFAIACPAGLGGFAPAFSAGTEMPTSGRHSPFLVRIARNDGDQRLAGIDLDLPTGLLANVRGVPLCGDAAAAAGSCPATSRVGTATVGAGPGPHPFFLQGGVFLTEGYKGGPYGLSVAVRVIAGPFDLGTVVVRQAIYVDPATAEVSVSSDPLPQIVKGVPVRLRSVDVDVDRPSFTLNPTSCSQKRIGAALVSAGGTVDRKTSRFQASECTALPFKPKLALALTGRRQTRTGKHPGIRAQVNQTGIGEAGIERAEVRLPKSLALDVNNAQALCEFADGTKPDLENHCPKGSIVGRARARTPLLKDDLVGNVYFVKNIRTDPRTGNQIRTLPMIIVALRGEIAINLKGESSTTKGGKLVNTFASVPDAPISRFNLNIKGGGNGIIAVTRTRKAKINLCAGRHVAEADMDGQNGRRHDFDVRMKTPCTKRQVKRAKRAAARAGRR